MSEQGRGGYQAVFRESWRERQAAGSRLGGLVRQPRWVDAGLVALAGLLVGGAVAGATVTVARTTALPAVADGGTVSAVRGSGPAPAVGSPAQFRTTTGTTGAVVAALTPTEVVARLTSPCPPSGGQLLVPAGRESLLNLLIPGLG